MCIELMTMRGICPGCYGMPEDNVMDLVSLIFICGCVRSWLQQTGSFVGAHKP